MNKNTWKEWFIFTRRDRNAATILLILIALLFILPYFLPSKKIEIHIDEALQKELIQFNNDHSQTNSPSYFTAVRDTVIQDTVKSELFVFDPNTLDKDGFIKLGLSQKTANTLINYRNKGGYFKTPEDIRKIYSLSKADADRLIPYVHIVPSTAKQNDVIKQEQPVTNTYSNQYKKININTATAEEWKIFPGIGEVIANRIVKFRTSMGGFKSVNQVAKTYGLSDSVFQLIKPYLYLSDSTSVNH